MGHSVLINGTQDSMIVISMAPKDEMFQCTKRHISCPV